MKKPAITEQASVFLVRDVSASIGYWADKVVFESTNVVGEPPEFAIMRRDAAYIMMGAARANHDIVPFWKARDGLWNAYFWVNDARALFAEISGRGANIDYALCTQPYGVLEFGIQDLDGHDIGFGEILANAERAE